MITMTMMMMMTMMTMMQVWTEVAVVPVIVPDQQGPEHEAIREGTGAAAGEGEASGGRRARGTTDAAALRCGVAAAEAKAAACLPGIS
jgi:hypothetical protein